MANILVVDDDRDLLKLVQTVLSRAGHTLTLAMNGDEALKLVQAQDFDLVVVDVMMPVMDGYELTRRLRADERTRPWPILILTARTQVADQLSAVEAGANAYLGKPLSYKDLTDKVRQLLEASGRPAKAAPEPAADPSRLFILNPSLSGAGGWASLPGISGGSAGAGSSGGGGTGAGLFDGNICDGGGVPIKAGAWTPPGLPGSDGDSLEICRVPSWSVKRSILALIPGWLQRTTPMRVKIGIHLMLTRPPCPIGFLAWGLFVQQF